MEFNYPRYNAKKKANRKIGEELSKRQHTIAGTAPPILGKTWTVINGYMVQLGPHEPCLCESGEKFKYCCRKPSKRVRPTRDEEISQIEKFLLDKK